MTKYCANIVTDISEETIALFSDKVTIRAMTAFAEEEFELGNSLLTPCKKIYIKDLTTGEVLCECCPPPEDDKKVLEGQLSLDDLH